jgi:hypothetical protein
LFGYIIKGRAEDQSHIVNITSDESITLNQHLHL